MGSAGVVAKVVNWQQVATVTGIVITIVIVTSQCYTSWVVAPASAGLCLGGEQGSQAFEASQKSPSRFHIQDFAFPGPVPWEYIRPSVRDLFTLNGSIQTIARFRGIDNFDSGFKPIIWKERFIAHLRSLAEKRAPRVCSYGENSTLSFYEAFDKYPVRGKSVLVVGSQKPWLEAILLAYNAGSITTVDFNKPISTYPGLTQWSIEELDATDETFDVVASYSSLEHDGLGRYGDPINPDGDLLRMSKLRGLLKPGGTFLLGVPVGNDTLVFNGHRIYGPIRMPLLLEGWELLDVFGVSSLEAAYRENTKASILQPVMVLK